MGKRILIGEDDVSILKMTKARLEHEGFEVLTAEDGECVLQQVGAHVPACPIHLILLDVKMPKMNGYTVCQQLKGQAETAGIPVIIFSASETHVQRLADRCIEIGATDWIKKPFRTTELMSKIRRALGEEESHA